MNDGAVLTALDAHAAALDAASRLRVALSGGLDSSVLLHAVHSRHPGKVSALHANHGLHGDAGAWEQHCASFCDQLGVGLDSTRLAVINDGAGPEAAARTARMAWFAAQLAPGDLLLLAHHRDDQAETLLLRLLRGAGPDGLAAMPVARPLGAGRLLRPLLALPRSALAGYAQRSGLHWIEDPSNSDDRFDRNYLRHRVMPLLRERWAGCDATLARAADLLREASAERPPPPPRCYSPVGDPGFALEVALGAEAGAALRVRAWLRDAGLTMPGRARLAEFLRQCRDGEGASLATQAWTLTRYRDGVFAHAAPARPAKLDRAVAPGEHVVIPGVGSMEVFVEGAAALPEECTLVLRLRRGGERLATAAGQHRTVKAVLQEQGIPPWWRDCLPLLFEVRDDSTALLALGAAGRSARGEALGVRLVWRPALLEIAPGRAANPEAPDD